MQLPGAITFVTDGILMGANDFREVLSRARGGDEDAQLALDVYVHRLRASIAAMAASLGGNACSKASRRR